MYKFFSRFTPTCIPNRFRNNTGAIAPHTQSFPVAQADLELLREQVHSLVEQRLDRSTLLALAKSTAFDMRKNVIRLNSIADIDAILDETDAIANLVFTEIGQHPPPLQACFAARILSAACWQRKQFQAESIQAFTKPHGLSWAKSNST